MCQSPGLRRSRDASCWDPAGGGDAGWEGLLHRQRPQEPQVRLQRHTPAAGRVPVSALALLAPPGGQGSVHRGKWALACGCLLKSPAGGMLPWGYVAMGDAAPHLPHARRPLLVLPLERMDLGSTQELTPPPASQAWLSSRAPARRGPRAGSRLGEAPGAAPRSGQD